jgi:hypothetical protein
VKIFPLNFSRLLVHAATTFVLVYLAYTPEIVISEGLHEKAEVFAREAGAEFSARIRSVSEANEMNGVLGMVDALIGREDGLAGLVTSTVRDMITAKLPPRVTLANQSILRWALFGAVITALGSVLGVLLWSKIDSAKLRATIGIALFVPVVIVVIMLTQAALPTGTLGFDSWNAEIYGTAAAIIVGFALFGRPLPYVAGGLVGLSIYAAVGLAHSGQLPGVRNQTLAAAESLSDIKGNLIDPKMAELSKIPIAGPLIVDFVDQIWRSPEHQQEIVALKKNTELAAASLRSLGTAEVAAGWLEVLVICGMLNIALVAVSRDMSLLRNAQAAAKAALPGPDTP